MPIRQCKYCSDDFKANTSSKFCNTNICRKSFYRLKKYRKKYNKEPILNEDYIICHWDGAVITGHIKRYLNNQYPDKGGFDAYIKEFPDALTSPPVYIDRISENSGQHMKTEKYKKIFSEKFKGEKNPNHKSNTTEKHRKSRSPFSKEFKNYDSEEERQEFINYVAENRSYTSQLDYWIDKCDGDIQLAQQKLKERQSTFTLDKCIEKYGEEKGQKVYNKRQENWSNLMEEKYKNGEYNRFSNNHYSESSKLFFDDLVNNYKETSNFMYGGNEYVRYFKDYKKTFAFDFIDKSQNKVIEYNGDLYHANPNKFSAYDQPILKIIGSDITAQEIWSNDKKRLDIIKNNGYDVLIIWESDVNEDRQRELNKCIKFLND